MQGRTGGTSAIGRKSFARFARGETACFRTFRTDKPGFLPARNITLLLICCALFGLVAGCGKPSADNRQAAAVGSDDAVSSGQPTGSSTAGTGVGAVVHHSSPLHTSSDDASRPPLAGPGGTAMPVEARTITPGGAHEQAAAEQAGAGQTAPAVRPTGHADPSEPAMLPTESSFSSPSQISEGKPVPPLGGKIHSSTGTELPPARVLDQPDTSGGPSRPPVLPNPLRADSPHAAGQTPARPDAVASRPLQPSESPTQTADDTAKPPPSRKSKRSGEPFDPIKENGPIFVGWPKPQAALVISGRQIGYLEPCGCAGLDRMKGGMGRRHTLMKTLAAKGWPAVGLDVGGVAKGFGKQAELKFATAIEGMRKMGYSVVGLGVEELRLPAGLLVSLGADTPTQPGMFLSANVALFGFDAKLTPRSRVLTLGGKKIGVTAVLGKRFQKQIQSNELELADPHKALGEVIPELARQADFLVLLAYTAMDEAVELAKSFPRFDLVVVAEGPAEPPDRFIEVEGVKARFVAVGEKGMNVVVVGLYDDPRQPLRYQRVPLDSRFEGSREMQLLMAAYQDQLKALGFAGLDLRPVPHPQKQTNGNFVSSKKCQSCHEESYRIWRRSRHAIAFDTLVNLDPPRHFDPECISCHVVGWHPTKYFPYQGGYQSVEKTPELIHVGCDACHGPGEGHVQAELGSDKQLQARMREAVRITKAEAADPTSKKANCYSCHDLDNSPDFNFEEYWPDVEHYEDQ